MRLSKADWLLGLTGAYCVISVMMNLLCTKPMSFGTGFVWMDGGLLISWIVFLISNVVTEVYGKRTAIVMAGVAAVVALFVNVVAALEVHLPTLPEYADQAGHFAYIFSNGPRTILASAIAFFVGNAVNCEIIDRFRRRAQERQNDNGIFEVLAFAPFGISLFEIRWVDIGTAVVTGTLIETAVEACFVGLITIPLTRHLKGIA